MAKAPWHKESSSSLPRQDACCGMMGGRHVIGGVMATHAMAFASGRNCSQCLIIWNKIVTMETKVVKIAKVVIIKTL